MFVVSPRGEGTEEWGIDYVSKWCICNKCQESLWTVSDALSLV